MANYQPQRGTYDAFYGDALNIEKITKVLKDIASSYAYYPIHTPIYESTELFTRSAGESSDIVTKEMFDFLDKGGRHISLRPEVTAGVMRAIVTNKLYATKDLPLKLQYFGPAFRYDRPQAGRYRQFNQFGVEQVGVTNAYEDAETIIMGYDCLKKLGFPHIILKINSIGDLESRANYKEALKEYFKDKIDNMCADCKHRFETNPLRILDCKVPSDQELVKDAPKMGNYLNEASQTRFDEVLSILDKAGVEYEVDPTLVRGLDYYSHVVFEFHFISNEGTNLGALGGGGHYDNLLKEVGGPKLSSVGFAFGIERLNSLLKEISPDTYEVEKLDAYLVTLGEVKEKAFEIATQLRRNNIDVDMGFASKSMKAQIKIALRKNAKYIVIIGEDEVKNDLYQLKNLETQEQVSLNVEQIINKLK
ncbi:MAG: histidine--tRNA ligase [Erysipelotrichaceae bacterium]|nr:histidine--tRNA ligase [Erysipelotrichaceae bacterium]